MFILAFLVLCVLTGIQSGPLSPFDGNKIMTSDSEDSGLFEGDISETSLRHMRLKKRNIGIGTSRWTDGIVFYLIDNKYDEDSRHAIERALHIFEEAVKISDRKCIQFVERKLEDNYVYITPEKDACYSNLGMKGGRQVTSVGEHCLRKTGKIMHEMMHVLGFLHEQSRFDRDDYVKVAWENVKTDQELNFEKYDATLADTLALPYDYGSLMHYSPKAFSKNGLPTILVNNADGDSAEAASLGQRERLSELDVTRVRIAYGCQEHNFTVS